MIAKRLKYLSIKDLISGPNFLNKAATAKKRKDLLIVEAVMKRGRLSLNTPEVMVNILYGMGVKPAKNTYQNPPFW